MQTKTWVVVVGVIGVLVFATGFVYFRGMRSTSPSPVVQNTPVSSQSPEAVDVREITVEGTEFSFNPSAITLKVGETVKLTFKNSGKFPHNFVIDELGVKAKTIQPGETDTVEFTAGKSGTFEFYCSVGNHRALGMQGDMEVK